LETNVTIACQHRCIACNHFVPLQTRRFKESMLAPETLARDLAHFARVARVDAWGALGGEPLLHPRLGDLLEVVRQSGITPVVEVWTNGGLVLHVDPALWDLVDRLVVSVYPGKMTDGELAAVAALCEARGVELLVKDERRYPNFTRLLERAPTDGATTLEKYRACWFKTYSRVLDNGFFYKCCTSPFVGPLLQGRPWGSDGLRVDEGLTERALLDFLADQQPLVACRLCAGRETRSALPVAWREVEDPQEWIAASAGALE
jgi:hypothetical protein